ncbi:MAG: protoporphyrinogen oxidase [Phycisphaerae bacterium]
MSIGSREIIIVGGGISGLTMAWHLKKAGVDVCLLEADPIVGGCTRTQRREGFILEKGPFNVIVRDPAFEALLDDVSDEVNVVTASRSARKRFIYRRGRLHAVPTHPIALAMTRLLSVGGRCRLLAGLLASPRAGGTEETIEQVATRRFGRETSDAIVSAAISGILAGDITKLSLKACFPAVASIDAEARSLIGYGVKSALRAMRKRKGGHRRRWRGLVSIEGGLGALTGALGRRLGADLLSGCRVEAVRGPVENRSHTGNRSRAAHRLKTGATGNGYEVDYRDAEGVTHTLQCRRLVLGTSAAEAGRLLQPLQPDATAILSSIESASLVVVNLGFRRSDIGHPMEGFGFLVPHDEPDFPLMGVLWADSIFPHHAPRDHRLMRVFIGGAGDPEAVERTDEELLATATGALRDLLQLSGDPVLVDVCRYPAAIPQYHRGHCEKIERLREAVATWPGLHLIGNYLEGVSLNDCVRLGTDASRSRASARTSRTLRPTRAVAVAASRTQ